MYVEGKKYEREHAQNKTKTYYQCAHYLLTHVVDMYDT